MRHPHRRHRVTLACRAALIGTAAVTRAADPTTAATAPAATDAGPVTVANARQFDFTSKVNGHAYRVMVYTSPKLDLAQPQPVVYVLDGSWYFGAAVDAAAINKLAGIIVAVGYPTEDRDEIQRRRTLDLSLPNAENDPKYGGGDAFLRVVDEEVKPLVAARYPVDPAHRSLFGHSLGGLMVLRELFRNPSAFDTFMACSPSIWWNSRAVLADEEPFSQRIMAGGVHVKLLVTSAADEQYHGTDAAILAKTQKGVRMVDSATELAARLAAVAPANMQVTRQVISGETHTSGAIASLCRALQFALATPAVR